MVPIDKVHSVVEKGFTFTTSFAQQDFSSISPDASSSSRGYLSNYTGSVALFNGADGVTTTLAQNNGRTFDIHSLDLANLLVQSQYPGGTTVNFTGALLGGGTVNETFNVAATDPLQHFTFDNTFTHLTSLSFVTSQSVGSGKSIQFDNLNLTPAAVPELSTSLGFGSLLALGGLAAFRQRKSARKAI